ncbi:MAG: hypothetical protein IKC35_04665 [Clostridia bacterium]|nr:hypothetical protein [Clostridia bacterium]
MRRFIALFGVMLLVIGIRLYNNGLLVCGYDGAVLVGEYDLTQIEKPLLIDGAHRLDIMGDEQVALSAMSNLDANVLFVEKVDDIKIFYAYSPRLSEKVMIKGREINLMVAVRNNVVSLGTPLLEGSY